MFQFLFFICFPFFFAFMVGSKRAGKLGLAVGMILGLLAMGFITGVMINVFTQPHSYWTSYHPPQMSTGAFVDSIGMDEPLYKMVYVPYIALWDAIKLYFHFTFTHGTIALWVCEIASLITIYNILYIFGAFPPKVKS